MMKKKWQVKGMGCVLTIAGVLLACGAKEAYFSAIKQSDYQNFQQDSGENVVYSYGTVSGEGQNLFSALPDTFLFTSGAGAWWTELHIAEDGTFSGTYQDSNMGETGDGYPNGTIHISNFKGSFSEPEKANQYMYYMKMENLQTEGRLGDSYIENGTRYIYSEPYGLNDAEEFFVYLPGTPLSSVEEGFLTWSRIDREQENALPPGFYGLYNVREQFGFTGEKENAASANRLDTTERTEESYYILPESNTRYLTEADLSSLSSKQICYAKNEIYARHGRKFLAGELTVYFNAQPWYQGTIEPENFTEDTVNQLFNEYEKVNIKFISDWENAHGEYVPQ